MGDAQAPADVDALLARIERLEQEGRALKHEVRGLQGDPDEPALPARDPDGGPVSRRRLIGMAGAAAAGAVGATALAASPAGATDGNPVLMGVANTGTLATRLDANNPTAAFYGVNADPSGGPGLRGESSVVGGTGVFGEALASFGRGLSGRALNGYSLFLAGPTGNAGAHMFLKPNPTITGPPTSDGHVVGEFWMDTTGVLFQCVGDGVPGTWVRQSPLVTLASPVRIYYSVTAGHPLLGDTQERSVTVTNGTTIPHAASAVLTNLAVTPSGADGFLAMFKDGTTWPGTSNLNYSAGAFASNNATSAVAFSAGTGKVKIHCGGGAVHFVIDVFGYYP